MEVEDINIIKKPSYIPHSSSTTPLAMHKNSQTISKTKPKIRIIHIFAPEIIKTDIENFRELVQRLTGKPNDYHQKKRPNRKYSTTTSLLEKPVMVTKKLELGSTFLEEDEEMMGNGANSDDFLNGFADFDGLFQQLGDFPLLPMDASYYNMHGLI